MSTVDEDERDWRSPVRRDRSRPTDGRDDDVLKTRRNYRRHEVRECIEPAIPIDEKRIVPLFALLVFFGSTVVERI